MRGSDVRAPWLRGQVLLVLLVPALVGASGQPLSTVVVNVPATREPLEIAASPIATAKRKINAAAEIALK